MKVVLSLEKITDVILEIGDDNSVIKAEQTQAQDEIFFINEDIATKVYQSLRANLKGEKQNGVPNGSI